MSAIDHVLAQAEALVGSLRNLAGGAPDERAAVLAAVEGPNNELPFKCPACGATYEVAVQCVNGHAPEQTIATADVLQGATMANEPDPTPQQAQNAVTETAVTPPPPAPAATPAAAPAAAPAAEVAQGPSWPEGGAPA